MNEIKSEHSFTSTENNELAMRARNGDLEAKEKLVLTNEKLIWAIVHKYTRSDIEKDDLFQEATIGFLTAIINYDIEKGSFSTYATSWMKAMIFKYFHKQEGFHIENSFYQKKIRYERMKNESSNSDINENQLKKYNLNYNDIKLIEKYDKEVYSLDSIIEQENYNECIFLDENLGFDSIESIVLQKERTRIIRAAIDKCLTDKEKFVILNKYGFDGSPMKMSEISKLYMKEFGIKSCKRQNIQQIKMVAEKKLKSIASLRNLV